MYESYPEGILVMRLGRDAEDLGLGPLIRGSIGAEIYLHITPLSQGNLN